MSEYQLRSILAAHTEDVRAVSVDGSAICTGSRDQTAILWVPSQANSNIYEPKLQYTGHSDYVMCVCLVPAYEDRPELTITGSKDKSVLVYPRYENAPAYTLKGHENAVSCLSWKDGVLASGSWDHTTIIWVNWNQQFHLKSHTAPVWAVKVISVSKKNCHVLTASADRTIILWNNNAQVTVYRGHNDCIRDLAVIDEERFLSCSNDASIKLWHMRGENLNTFFGHQNFIYSVSILPNSDVFVSGGEDRTLRVWNLNNGENINTTFLPSQSVWAVAMLPNNDIVAGVSDASAYVFTSALERKADSPTQKTFTDSLEKSAVSNLDLGGLSKNDLPDDSRLLSPGKKDGQTVMIKSQDKVFCYSWSASAMKWNKVGEVVGGAGGSAGSSGKVLYQGKEYDYVFDVDTDLGSLKLPYDLSEDPWLVAQKFIHTHNLPQDHLTQIADFIIKNARVTTFATPTYSDPFTGSSRYIPGSAGIPTSPTFPTANVPKTYNHFPHRTPISFQSMNKVGILGKLKEMNAQMDEKISNEDLESLVEAVCSESPSIKNIKILEVALKWPSDKIWPALDALRLALRSVFVQKAFLNTAEGETIFTLLHDLVKCEIANVRLMCLRCLSNMACHPPGREVLVKNNLNVVSDIVDIKSVSDSHEIAVGTVLLNQVVSLLEDDSLDRKIDTLGAAMKLLINLQNGDALYRVLVGIGTLLSTHENILSYGRSLDLKKFICDKISEQSLTNNAKVKECGKELLDLL